jgi:hypothetical protein
MLEYLEGSVDIWRLQSRRIRRIDRFGGGTRPTALVREVGDLDPDCEDFSAE